MSLPRVILNALIEAIGNGPHNLHEPKFTGNEKKYLQDCIDSSYVSSVGKYVDSFEKEIAKFTGCKRAVAVVNGTAALQISLKLSEVKSNDEIIIPAVTFIATANAVSYLGANPHFVDISQKSLCMDAKSLRNWLEYSSEKTQGYYRNRITGNRIKAIIPMHTFGNPCEMEELLAIAHDFKLSLIEDAAESLGSYYFGKHTGTFGKFGILSFNGNKIITTGGGGMILTNDIKLASMAKHLTTTAKVPHKWNYVHDSIGYNYRMPNINAALGLAQLENIQEKIKSKRKLYQKYFKIFKGINGVKILRESKNCISNYWLQTLILDEKYSNNHEKILKLTNKNKIMTRPLWELMSNLKPYKDCQHSPLPISKSLRKRVINLPSSPGLI